MRSLLRGRRVSLSLLAVLILFLLAIVISHLVSFIHIFSTHAGIALTQHEVSAAHNATTPDPRPQLIPKIIHQIFHNWNDPGNETIPSDWDEQRLTCMTVNTDWEYKVRSALSLWPCRPCAATPISELAPAHRKHIESPCLG